MVSVTNSQPYSVGKKMDVRCSSELPMLSQMNVKFSLILVFVVWLNLNFQVAFLS